MEFEALNFIAYELSNDGKVLSGSGYQYILVGYPFGVSDLSFEGGNLNGNFEGYLFNSPIIEDTLTTLPVYVQTGSLAFNWINKKHPDFYIRAFLR